MGSWMDNQRIDLAVRPHESLYHCFVLSEFMRMLIRHLSPLGKVEGLLNKLEAEAVRLWTRIRPMWSSLGCPITGITPRKSICFVVIMGQMLLLKCIFEITSLNMTIKIIKMETLLFLPQVSKNSLHRRNHFARRSAWFRDALLSPLRMFQEYLSWKRLQRRG